MSLTATIGEITGLVPVKPRLKAVPRPRDTKKDELLRRFRIANYRLSQEKQKLRRRIRELTALLAGKPSPRVEALRNRVAKGLCMMCPRVREPERSTCTQCLRCAEKGKLAAQGRRKRMRHPCADCSTLVKERSSRCAQCAPRYRERKKRAIREGRWSEPI